MKRLHIFFSGRVQRVFFRKTCLFKARMLGLKGWVKNLQDGRVEALIEGEEEKIKKLITNIGKGNPLIRVDYTEIIEEEYKEEFKDFKITY